MVNVDEATDIVFSNLFSPAVRRVPLSEAVGGVLAEAIVADRDLPPFHRVVMDGIAIRYERYQQGGREFRIESVQAAGQPQKKLNDASQAIEVMTGAVLPEGVDTVIRYEDLNIANNIARITTEGVTQGQQIHKQGSDALKNETLLEPGIVLSPAEIALMASVGVDNVKVYSLPAAAIISSGDELVAVSAMPEAHQVRRSNTYALEAAMKSNGWPASSFHLDDNKESIVAALRHILDKHDVLIISGGVSKGKFDFIPEALEANGVKKLFHQVSQRPGKPFWFGKSDTGKIVFALPGNPVSTYMCFYRFVLPWLKRSLRASVHTQYAILGEDFTFSPGLTYFLQVSVKNERGKLMAYPHAGGGSGDFANLKTVDGFLELPREQEHFAKGDVYPYFPFRAP